MFCKFCGKQIDRKTMQCVGCGKPVGPLEGGVGFWDLVGEKPSKEVHPEPPVSSERMDKHIERIISAQKHLDKRIAILSTLMAGVLICSIMLNVILIIFALGMRKDHEYLTNYLQSRFEQENVHTEPQNIETTLPETEPPEVTAQEATDAGVEVINSEQAAASIIITKQPKDVPVSEKVEAGATLFTLKAEGENLTFQWQKFDAKTESWGNVNTNLFDLECNEDSSETTLFLKTRTPEIYGKFRCVIANDTTGAWVESTVAKIYDPDVQGVAQ